MLRSTVTIAIAVMCWTRLSLGFVPSAGKPNLPTSALRTTSVRYRSSDALLEAQREELKSRLPPVGQQTSKLQIEFRELLKAMLYTPQEMSTITNPRVRALFEGISASYYEPAVYRAFEVLYEDYLPLRLAGRIIHGKLQEMMDQSKEYQQDQLKKVASKTGFPMEALERSWDSFVTLAGDREMTTAWVETILHRGQERKIIPSSEPNIINAIVKPNQRKTLAFDELVDSIVSVAPYLSAVALEELLTIDNVNLVSQSSSSDAKRVKYSQRYDAMLVQFGEWKRYIPSGEGRRLDILNGCFVGSENPKVVEALRIIYTDYSALRMSGDWIFQVVSTLMKAAMKRGQRNSRTP